MLSKTLYPVVFAALTLLSVNSVFAQEADENDKEEVQTLEEIVVESVRRVATPVSDVTRSVTVVTKEELQVQSRLDRSAGSVLAQKVPGFSPSTVALTNYGQTLRGRKFQTLIDGVPQDTSMREGFRSLQSIDINAVEQIEIIRGGTAVYGSCKFNAILICPPNRQQIPLLPYIVVLESGGCDKHLYEIQVCYHSNSYNWTK